MSRLVETELFVRVAEEGSFTAAARRLNVTTSYASKLPSPRSSTSASSVPRPSWSTS